MEPTPAGGLKIELPQPDPKDEVLKFFDEGIGNDENYSKPVDEPISRGSSEHNTAVTTGSSGFESMGKGVRIVKYKDRDEKKKSVDRIENRRFKKSLLKVESQTSTTDSSIKKIGNEDVKLCDFQNKT
ncbi:unnamed protein product [Hymenolepis diminuta]|uniref:DUF4604 domain-containing protein n=1 Tax=Hymenolepis diminuta TaxID=6216 RepID=A0A0R3SBM0_HYMDI|nr:unnamed protein product [Hymenolepis diminuta]